MQTRPALTPEREEKIKRVLGLRQKGLTLVLANIHDPHNVSAIYRSCDAFGVPNVHLYYTHTPFPKLGAKSSASARKWVDSKRYGDKESLFSDLHTQGMQVLATSCTGKAQPVSSFDLTKPTAIILGNEHSGVDEDLVPLAHAEVYIPMFGMIQSFNVSVAAAVLLAEASRQRQAAGFYETPRYTPEELDALYDDWSQR